MAEPRHQGSSFGTFGTREEDWPDVDGDLDTEEGVEAMRHADAALHATIERSMRQRNAQLAHADSIPRALYINAQNKQHQLTDEERQLLLSRGDVVGKALARPESLTTDEMHQVLLWPPPDVVRANIQRATGGQLNTPIELYAQGKDALDRGNFSTMLNDEEVALLARRFHAGDDASFSEVGMSQALSQPGAAQAAELLSSMLGLDFAVFHAALVRQVGQIYPMRQMAPTFPDPGLVQSLPLLGPGVFAPQDQLGQRQQPSEIISAMTALHEQHRLGNITDEEVAARNSEYVAALQSSSQVPSLFSPNGFGSPWPATTPPSNTDRHGSGSWPPTARPQNPITIYANEAGVSGHGVEPGYSVLCEDQKSAYRARSETLRHEAWAQQDTIVAEGPSPFALPGPGPRQEPVRNLAGLASRGERLPMVPARPGIITGLSVFRDEQETEWQEVLRRWEALSEEQRQVYEARAATANAAARATFREGRTL
ncbi:glucan -beta-glucosidase [Colletotrichum kahawae]|uniref:Glucan -beta-glucosidase n=1 Tax=Colletotrichum kahawae TaxID=34407 RepID=A0AAD9YHG4_COLKA|nr:glucan -beta-glucosidase [Colletotrichum kahawae]